jgi:hypothetical protein
VRVLLDEGVPDIIQKHLKHLSIATVQELGWRGIRNGNLLDLMVGRFQLLIRTDKNLPFQQNLFKRQISVIGLPSNRIRILKRLMPRIALAIDTIRPGESVQLSDEDEIGQ